MVIVIAMHIELFGILGCIKSLIVQNNKFAAAGIFTVRLLVKRKIDKSNLIVFILPYLRNSVRFGHGIVQEIVIYFQFYFLEEVSHGTTRSTPFGINVNNYKSL